LGWGISRVKRRFQQKKDSFLQYSPPARAPLTAMFAQVAVVAFSLLALVFLLGLVAIFTDIDPSYGAPRVFYGLTPLAGFIFSLPWPLAVLGGAMVVFTVLSWWKNYWTWGARLHYTLVTAAALGLLWVMAYSNLF